MRDDSTPHDDDTIKVCTDGPEGPYLLVATAQVPQLQVLFDGMALPYTIKETVVDEVEGSSLTTIEFASDTDTKKLQSLLDGMH